MPIEISILTENTDMSSSDHENILESLSKEDLIARVKALQEENKSLSLTVTPLKDALAAKERDCKRVERAGHNNYDNIAKHLMNLKSKMASSTDEKMREIAIGRKRPGEDSLEKPPKKIRPKTLPAQRDSPKGFKCFIRSRKCAAYMRSIDTIEDYRQHVKEIHPEYKWFCEWCPYAALSERVLKRHCKKWNHAGEYWGCKLCGISFVDPNLYPSHFQIFHKSPETPIPVTSNPQ